MDYTVCNVIYVDCAGGEDKIYKSNEISDGPFILRTENALQGSTDRTDVTRVEDNIRTLLKTFNQVHFFASGKSLIPELANFNELSRVDTIPTLILIDVPYNDYGDDLRASARTPSPMSSRQLVVDSPKPGDPPEKFYGTALLQWIASDIQQNQLSRLFVPIVLSAMPSTVGVLQSPVSQGAWGTTHIDQKKTMRYIDIGAMDVCTSPIPDARVASLAIHAYRAHKDSMREHFSIVEQTRGRKRSWVGLDEQKPYAYLREAMVSGLMDGICRLEPDDIPFEQRTINVSSERKRNVQEAVSSWHFSAHEFSDDELLYAAIVMLEHTLSMPDLEQWRISTESLTGFLVACRSAYNDFVPYHNFRHVIDVLQACFHFLVRNGTIPPYRAAPSTPTPSVPKPSPIAALLKPFDGLTLLITAIGHDVGHPGVNNAFLIKLNAPLAQLYNDRSVLESFHCAAYSQILRRHWPSAFTAVDMRQLMISSILATDMGLHFDYMKKLGFLEEKLHENKGTDGWNGRTKEEYRTLACSLLIKCADISNVARRYDVAAKWTMILTDEFARQASMERDLSIPSALFAPPVREIIELGQSQIGFMNMFAIPLFSNVTNVLPEMQFCVDELQKNRKIWEERIEYEQDKKRMDNEGKFGAQRQTSVVSPMTQRKSSTFLDAVPPLPTLDKPRGSVVFSKSPLGNPSANVPDTNFSTFRALQDIPSEEQAEDSYPSAGSLLPPSYAFPNRTAQSAEGGPQVENSNGLENRGLSEHMVNKSTIMPEEPRQYTNHESGVLKDSTNLFHGSGSEQQDPFTTEPPNDAPSSVVQAQRLHTTGTNQLSTNDTGTASNTSTSATTHNSRGNPMTTNSSNASSNPVSPPGSTTEEKDPSTEPSGPNNLQVSAAENNRTSSRNGEATSDYGDISTSSPSPGKLAKKNSRSRFIRFFKKKGSNNSDGSSTIKAENAPAMPTGS